MIQIQLIRNKAEWVKERLAVKNFKETGLVDEIVVLDEQRRKNLKLIEENKAKQNEISKSIGNLMQQGKKDEVEESKQTVTRLKGEIAASEELLKQIEKDQFDKLVQLPNLPGMDVPLGKTPEENVVVREGGIIPTLAANAVPHWDLCKQYNLVDFELGNKITGSGFPVYIGK